MIYRYCNHPQRKRGSTRIYKEYNKNNENIEIYWSYTKKGNRSREASIYNNEWKRKILNLGIWNITEHLRKSDRND